MGQKAKKSKAREDMETGDTARSGPLSGVPPEYGTNATDFFSQPAPPGLQLLEPHDHHVVTTVSSQIGLSVWRIPFGGFFFGSLPGSAPPAS